MATLELVYSGGTLNLLDTTNYVAQADGWVPAMTYLRDSDFGGVGPYADVDETLLVAVRGTTAAARYANLRKLGQAMDEATRWARGEALSPVLLRYAPDGASAGTLSAVVLGRPYGGDAPFSLSTAYASAAGSIPDNTLRFQRRGLFLYPTEDTDTESIASNKVANFSFATSHPMASPVKLTITQTAKQGAYAAQGQYAWLLFVSGSSLLRSVSAIASTGGALSSVAVTDSTWGNVLRYTPATALSASQTYGMGTTAFQSSRLIHVWTNVKRSHATGVSYTLRARLNLDGGATVYGPTVSLASGAGAGTECMPVYLGALPAGANAAAYTSISSVTMLLTADVGTAGHTLDLDTIVMLAENDGYARAIAIAMTNPLDDTLIIDHQLLSRPEPDVRHAGTTTSFSGDAVLMATGQTCSALFLSGYNSVFSMSEFIGAHAMTAARMRGFYLPE